MPSIRPTATLLLTLATLVPLAPAASACTTGDAGTTNLGGTSVYRDVCLDEGLDVEVATLGTTLKVGAFPLGPGRTFQGGASATPGPSFAVDVSDGSTGRYDFALNLNGNNEAYGWVSEGGASVSSGATYVTVTFDGARLCIAERNPGSVDVCQP